MKIWKLRAKLHGVEITGKKLYYNGSITIGEEYMEAVGLIEGERVEVFNMTNGARFSTYVILGKGREIVLNGAAARLGEIGDKLIIVAYALMDLEEAKAFKPKILIVSEENGGKV